MKSVAVKSALQILSIALTGAAIGLAATPRTQGADAALVLNGAFEHDRDADGIPDGWRTSGKREIEQSLTLDTGHTGNHSARLACTHFEGDGSGAHVMMLQSGHADIQEGQWYRLGFWTKGKDIHRHLCEVKVMNTETWSSCGISAAFPVTPQWRYTEWLCQATAAVPAPKARLQFFFKSTGTLWLDDVQLEPVQTEIQRHPQLSAGSGRNLIPNSSFECGTAGWGSYTPQLGSWPGNLFRLIGDMDPATAAHGTHSVRVTVGRGHQPVLYWDHFDPHTDPIRSPLIAHHGWVRVRPAQTYTLSCYLKGNLRTTPAMFVVYQNDNQILRHRLRANQEWTRHQFRFTPQTKDVWVAVGPDLPESSRETETTLWLDGLQLEPGYSTSDYRPYTDIEVGLQTSRTGNIFTNTAEGIALDVCMHNASPEPQRVHGTITATDFFDREVLNRRLAYDLSPGETKRKMLTGLLANRQGFYRFRWQRDDDGRRSATDVLRCALVAPYTSTESVFGVNHAYPWHFMLPLCRTAGLIGMRDWSAKWHAVEPSRGTWRFSDVDAQIDRIADAGLKPLMLFPFPSAFWNSTADIQKIRRLADGNRGLERRYTLAHASESVTSFGNYIGRNVAHYQDRVAVFGVLNEPIYTSYALPDRFGYTVDDYIRHLAAAYSAAKAAHPSAVVVGGIGAWADHPEVSAFIEAGALQWCDIMDMHLYPATVPPELYAADLRRCRELMKKHGDIKPIWLTEFGCYADDDPHITPTAIIGDSAMSRANWPNERAASEALVKSAAVFLSHGIARIYYHSGTCGIINGRSGDGVFFEYGGTPRKMYAAQNVLARMLGPTPRPVSIDLQNNALQVYGFETERGAIAIVWSSDGQALILEPGPNISGFDIMGNPLPPDVLTVSETPIYLKTSAAGDLASQARLW